ncbi:uncharacterized protein LOC101236819 [Hydra vulgaris]|uniref:Mediator of RNA polymerase II transcription subunit 26 n=1 Tax=Hydra vulgaris TaxID=6087 RepID=A0ABM4C6Y5_HYDVU
MPPTALEIKARLDKAVDPEGNVLNMEVVLEVVSCLERLAMTSEALEVTRIGRTINTMRKKTQNKELAKRAKKLVEKWRAQVLSNNHIRRALNNDSPTSIVTNGSTAVVIPKDKILIEKSIEQTEDIKLSRKRKKLKPDCSPSNNSVNNSFSCKLNYNTLTINKADSKLKSVSNTALSQVTNSKKMVSIKPIQTVKISDSKTKPNSLSNAALSQVLNSSKTVSPKPIQVSKTTNCLSIDKQLLVKKKVELQNENISVPSPSDAIHTSNTILSKTESNINFNTNSVVENTFLNKAQSVTPEKKINKIKASSPHLITNYPKEIKDVNTNKSKIRTSEDAMNLFHQNFLDKDIELLNNNIEIDKNNFEKHKDLILFESHSMTIEPEDLAVCRKEHPNNIVNPESLADGINGVYDKDGVWKSWTEHLYLRNNTLCILPYVVLE